MQRKIITRRTALATAGAGGAPAIPDTPSAPVPTLPLDKRRLPSVLQEGGTLGRVLMPRSMVAGYTDPYLVRCDGDCLSPEVNDGDSVVASPDAPVTWGKFVIMYPKDGGKPSVKRAIMIPPPDMMEVHPDSEFMPMVIVEQLNPPREYRIDVDRLDAVHGVLGVIPKGEAVRPGEAPDAHRVATAGEGGGIMTGVTPRMAVAGFEPASGPKGARRTAMLLPKPRKRREIIPPMPTSELIHLEGELGPDERRAMRALCQTADLFVVGDQAFLLAPVSPALVDTLATFEAEGEGREPDDEPELDDPPERDDPDEANGDQEPSYG